MIEQSSSLARSLAAMPFLPPDEGEAVVWATEHTVQWEVVGRETTSEIWTLFYVRKEGDTAYFPFSYVWDGKKVVKQYHEEKPCMT